MNPIDDAPKMNAAQLAINEAYGTRFEEIVDKHCKAAQEAHGFVGATLVNVGIMLWQHCKLTSDRYGNGPELQDANEMMAGILNRAVAWATPSVEERNKLVPPLQAAIKAAVEEIDGMQDQYNDEMVSAADGLIVKH